MNPKYPHVPDYALPPAKKRNTATANGLTQAILDYCSARGIFCERVTSEGRYRAGEQVTDVVGRVRVMKGQWLPGLMKGWPDLVVLVPGHFIGLEIKIGKDRQSDGQKKIEARIKAAGHKYYIIRSLDDFLKIIT